MKRIHKHTLDDIRKRNSADGDGDQLTINTQFPTIGVVMNTDDPLQEGRLQVFCSALGDNPKKIHHLPWCKYLSPFGGTINSKSFVRGVKDGPETTDGAVSYGMWAIPEQGANVMVMCLDGDSRRRIWMGGFFDHQETHTLHHGRFSWENGSPDGPLSSSKQPIEPLYSNMAEAYNGNKDSREFKTRGAEYQVTAVDMNVGENPNSSKTTYLDEQYEQISEAEVDGWVKPILGAHGYDWTKNKKLGSFKASQVIGLSSPGMHALTMDDRAFNARLRLRSGTGHQVLMDDTNERIYIATNKGKTFLEMDSNGNIDVYGERRMSFTADDGFNFNTNDTFRVHAKKGIHLYAGDNNDQENLPNPPEDGEIRIQSVADMHLITEKNMRQFSTLDTKIEIGGKKCETIGDSLFLQVQNDINILTNTGNYNLTVSANLNEFAQGNATKMALGVMKNMSNGNAHMYSYRGKMDVGAQKTLNMKSVAEDVALESVGRNEQGNGCVLIKSPNSQYGVTSEGVYTTTNKKIVGKADERIDFVQEPTKQNEHTDATDPGECDLGGTVDIEGYTGADLAARLAYNAGFRGADLVTAVAIAGGESGYDVYAQNNADGRAEKWGPSYGLWQIRTLQHPEEWSGIDAQRDPAIIGGPENVQNNANLSYQIYGRSGFREWGAYTNGSYADWLDQAQTAVTNLCAGPEPMLLSDEETFDQLFQLDLPQLGCGKSLMDIFEPITSLVNQAKNAWSMVNGATNIQVESDINIKSLDVVMSSKIFDKIIPKINELSDKLNKACLNIAGWMQEHILAAVFGETVVGSPLAWAATAVSAAKVVAGLADFIDDFSFPTINLILDLADLDLEFDKMEFESFKMPLYEVEIWAVFDLGNHDGCTLLDIDGFKISQAPTR